MSNYSLIMGAGFYKQYGNPGTCLTSLVWVCAITLRGSDGLVPVQIWLCDDVGRTYHVDHVAVEDITEKEV
jgi:hypothetical protein